MYGYGYRGGFYFDSTYLLVLIGMILVSAASWWMKKTFSKYSAIGAASRLTGEQTAQRVLSAAGIRDVRIQRVGGNLTDHYDPASKTVCLSQSVYGQTSVAAVCVAAHECGHAIQHHENYAPLSIRSSLVPAANLGSRLSWPLLLAGIILSFRPLAMAGVILFSLAVLFQLVTLPVEFNASSRALTMLESTGILGYQENQDARKVLFAAAMTYVASVAASVLQLLRLLAIVNGRRRR